MAGGFEFEDIIAACVYVMSVWVAGKLFALTGGTPLVGEIIMGMILGPYLINILGPFNASFQLAGEIGLLLLVMEAGIEVDLNILKMVGLLGVAVAFAGSAMPMALGYSFSYLYGYDTRACLSCAAALAPTSMGIAINVLKSGKVLDTPTGQLIIAAAIVDDVIALVLLSELRALNEPDPSVMDFAIPIISATVSLVVGMLMAVFVFPRFMQWLLPQFPEATRGNLVLGMCLILGLVLMCVLNIARASYLLGCFLAGLCFCTVHEIEHAWVDQVKRIMYLLLHIFFSATIGFEIPITELWTLQTILRMLGYVACMSGKVATGIFARPLTLPEFLTIGWAMAAWGEFAFLVANESYSDGIITKEQFMPLAFAILMSAIIAPFMLKFVLTWKNRKQKEALHKHTERVYRHRESIAGVLMESFEGPSDVVPVYYKVVMQARAEWNLIPHLINAVQSNDCEILDTRVTAREGVALHVLFLADMQLELPLLCAKGSPEAEALQHRARELHDAFASCCTSRHDVIVLTVARWHPHLLGHPDDLDAAILEEMRADYGRDLATLTSADILARRSSFRESEGDALNDPNMIIEGYTSSGTGPVQALLYDNRQLDNVFKQDAEDARRGRRLSRMGDLAIGYSSTGLHG